MPNKDVQIIRTKHDAYILIFYNMDSKLFYKIPAGSFVNNLSSASTIKNDNFCGVHICENTSYNTNMLPVVKLGIYKQLLVKHLDYKPVYFERFKYVGKGFKLILKKKRNMFNCIFGHSHIYWVKLQQIFVKKTKKYKYMFVAKNLTMHTNMLNILRKIKPINRYTLRGVRTYTHVWIKRKGRKSVATHV